MLSTSEWDHTTWDYFWTLNQKGNSEQPQNLQVDHKLKLLTSASQIHSHNPLVAFWAKNLMKVRQEKWARECMSSRFSKVPNLGAHSHTKWMNSCRSSHPQWLRHWAPQKPSHQSLETYQTGSLLFDALTLQEKNPRTSINVNPWVRFL